MRWPLAFLLAVLAALCTVAAASNHNQTLEACEFQLKAWAGEINKQHSTAAHDGGDRSPELLFFLHIPRTGGRTFHQCFLKSLIPPQQHCPRSYDVIHVNLRNPGCRLLVTHDDYSILERIRGSQVSVVTNVRDPVDRVLSAYEFTAEIVVRGLVARRRAAAPSGAATRPERDRVSTKDVWPWSKLVPMMEADVFHRNLVVVGNATASGGRARVMRVKNRIESVMPLEQFVKHPLVRDLLHNGATFQIAGLTDTSLLPSAQALRTCVINHPTLGSHVLTIAKQRLSRMLSVGLSNTPEEHHRSAAILASELPLLSRPYGAPHTRSKEWPEKVMRRYSRCVEVQRNRYKARRDAALQHLASSSLSRDMRSKVPKKIVAAIRTLNGLDVELHAFAQELFREKEMLLDAKKAAYSGSHAVERQERASSRKQCDTLSFLGNGCNTTATKLHFEETLSYLWPQRLQAFNGISRYLWSWSSTQINATSFTALMSAAATILVVQMYLVRTVVVQFMMYCSSKLRCLLNPHE